VTFVGHKAWFSDMLQNFFVIALRDIFKKVCQYIENKKIGQRWKIYDNIGSTRDVCIKQVGLYINNIQQK